MNDYYLFLEEDQRSLVLRVVDDRIRQLQHLYRENNNPDMRLEWQTRIDLLTNVKDKLTRLSEKL